MNINIKHIIGVLSISALLPMMASCSMDNPFEDDREGVLTISTDFRGDLKQTRALSDDEKAQLRSKCVVYIESSRGLIRKFIGADQIPENIRLKVGSYVAEAWSGDSVSASFDKKFYRAYQKFEMQEGNNDLAIKCNIANVVVSLDPECFNAGVTDLKVDFWHSRGELSFDASNKDEKGYFMMPNADKDLQYKVSGKQADGTAFEKTGTIPNVERGHEYSLNVLTEERPITEGGALIRIVIADIPLIEDEIEIFMPPVLSGVDYAGQPLDIKKQVVAENGVFDGNVTVKVRGYEGLSSLKVNFSDNFAGMTNGENILNNEVQSKLNNLGITIEKKSDTEKTNEGEIAFDDVYVTFTKAFLDGLVSSDTEYIVEFEGTDGRHQTGISNLRIANSPNAVERISPVGTPDAPSNVTSPMAILAHEANLQGNIFDKEAAVNPRMMYREQGVADWQTAYPTSTANFISRKRTRADVTTFDVKLTDLKAGTTYEYKVVSDGFEDTDIKTFTTEGIFTLKNASFEDWSTYSAETMLGTKNVNLPWSVGDKLASFWGSGNEGAATAGKVLTNKSTDLVHSGEVSVRLKSDKAMNILAAGNIFVGHYDRTDGTNGVLQLGREYNGSHPSKLVVWANYRPGTVDLIKSENQQYLEIVKDELDHGQIYVALTTAPVEIRTNPKNRKLFDCTNDETVLAYGQVTWKENFGVDGSLSRVEIPIIYNERAKTTIPKYMIIVASASKFGDYFSGSSSSVMYLDDFELIYDK